MEGYSVTEAASVLGVPTERVWELLARGVLSGVPDGETGMRVFLQPRPAPPAVDEPPRTNGHGDARQTDAEASPFRELLTEFRGLTERYGQALLALGEARGEVASLRSRVDVLEARMDLRLPFASPMNAASTWAESSSPATEPKRRASDRRAATPVEAADHDQPAEAEASVDVEPDGERSARRKRSRAHFSDEFADALARAEDPSPAVLRDAAEAGAFAAVHHDRDESAAEAEAADAVLPRELPPAESMAVMEPEPELVPQPEPAAELPEEPQHEPELASVVELVAEPDVAAAHGEGAEPGPEAALEFAPEPEAEAEAELEPEPPLELAPEPEPAAQPEAGAQAVMEPEPALGLAPEPEAEPEAAVEAVPEPEPALELAPEPEAEPEAAVEAVPEPEPAPELPPQTEPVAVLESQPDVGVDAEPAEERQPEPELEPTAEPAPGSEAEQRPAQLEPEPEPEPEAEIEASELPAAVETEAQEAAQREPVAAPNQRPELEEVPAAEPALEPAAAEELAPGYEPEPAPDTIEEPELALEPPPEPEPSPAPEPAAVAAEAEESSSEPSWDPERYTTQIDEPDWWMPEESFWAEEAASSEPISAETVIEVPKPVPPDVDEPAQPVMAGGPIEVEVEADGDEFATDREAAAPPRFQVDEPVVSNEPYRGEETMLWFGRRPEPTESAGEPSEDAAGEMEVASTGRRGWVSSEEGSPGLPGAQELNDALHAFDSPGGEPGTTAAEQDDPPVVDDEPQAPRTPPTMWAAPPATPTQAGELRSPASRAYRRLRRIFPG